MALLPELLDDVTNGKLHLKMGPRYARTVIRYTDMAGELFNSPEQQDEAKEWIRRQLLQLAAENDIKWIPNWLEGPLEKFAINLAVDFAWELVHSPGLRRGLTRAAGLGD